MTPLMNAGHTLPARRVDRLGRVAFVLGIVALGVLAGLQFVMPDKRVLAVAMAALVFGVAWRLDTVSAIGLLVLALPYPRSTTFGSTNFALLLFVLLIWLLRARTDPRQAPAPTGVDVPIAGLLIANIISFYNVKPIYAAQAFANFLVFLSAVVLFYIVVNNVRTGAQLQKVHLFQTISMLAIAVFGMYEVNHSGAVIVPGWIILGGPKVTEGIELHDVRIGGPFFDFELLGEFSAISLFFTVFRMIRAGTVVARVAWGGLATVLLAVMFATVTRGAIISLAIGTLYLLWVQRRHLQFVPLTIAAGALFAVVQVVAFVVNTYSSAGDMFGRLLDTSTTRFVGVMPQARAEIWSMAFERILEHPLIGHAPFYPTQEGTQTFFWPHNGYLYVAYVVGFVGLGFFLWTLAQLWRMSWIGGQPFRRVSYARAFLVIANTQLVVFMFDQIKIDYLRNQIYTYQVWLMFAMTAATSLIVRREDAAARRPAA